MTGVVEVLSPDDVLAVEDDEVEALVVPGIVFALIAPNRPTPMTALIAAPVVSRLRRRMAASRAPILAWVVSLFSMAQVLPSPLNPD